MARIGEDCFTIEFDQAPGTVVSCVEPLALQYTKRECSTQKLVEIAAAEAMVSCEDKQRITLHFKSSSATIAANLRVNRTSQGREGLAARYKVESSRYEETSLSKLLAEPQLKPLGGEKPEESAIKFKFSGFAALEYERTKRYGFDGTTAQANFRDDVKQPDQGNLNFFSNLNFEASKDRTSLVSVMELGEVYFGDNDTGGAVSPGGGIGKNPTTVIELRNLYLSHSFNDFISAKGGRITTNSDPRAFIFSDHIASLQANYKTDLSEGLIWYGNASQNRPAATRAHNHYLGMSGTLGFLSGIKGTAFYTYNGKNDTFEDSTGSSVDGDSITQWAGGTFDWSPTSALAIQATGIYNWGSFSAGTEQDHLKSYLLDTKLVYTWEAPQIVFTLEGVMTPGSKDGYNGSKPIIGKRKNFVSPINASYLLTVATSDGFDDAPGSPKESVIAGLGNAEGLKMAVFTTSGNITKRATVFGRYGYLTSAVENATTNSTALGSEVDVGGVYQVSPSTTFQVDYGHFMPGSFYAEKKYASLLAGRFKFSF